MSVPALAASGGGLRLQVVYAWRKHLVGYRLLGGKGGNEDAISVGVSKRATFVAPSAPGWPKRHGVLRPNKRGGFRLRLLPELSLRFPAFVRRTLPDLVILKRLSTERLDFCFGMGFCAPTGVGETG